MKCIFLMSELDVLEGNVQRAFLSQSQQNTAVSINNMKLFLSIFKSKFCIVC